MTSTVELKTEKKEEITTFNIAPADGIQLLREKANAIQEKCTDVVVRNVSLNNFAVNCSEELKFKGLFHNGENVLRTSEFTDYAFGQLCNKLGVPAKYMTDCVRRGYTDLAKSNLNTWIDDYNKDLMLRLYEDKIRGVLSTKYSVFDTPDIVDVLGEATRGLDLKVKGYFLSPERFHARLIQSRQMHINGEDLFAGIQIDSSDVGRNTLTVNFFIFKQICTNGLCVSKGKAKLFTQKHIGICTSDFKEELTQSLKLLPQLISEYEYIIQKCATQYNLIGSKYTANQAESDKMFEEFIQKIKLMTKLSEDGAKKVAELSGNRYGFSDWGVVNAITEVAQDYTLERRIELERIAGNLLKVS